MTKQFWTHRLCKTLRSTLLENLLSLPTFFLLLQTKNMNPSSLLTFLSTRAASTKLKEASSLKSVVSLRLQVKRQKPTLFNKLLKNKLTRDLIKTLKTPLASQGCQKAKLKLLGKLLLLAKRCLKSQISCASRFLTGKVREKIPSTTLFLATKDHSLTQIVMRKLKLIAVAQRATSA